MFSRSTRFGILSCLTHTNPRSMASTLPCVYVRCIPDEERMQISINYDRGGVYKVKTFNMERPQQETLGKALFRLQQNILKVLCKHSKRKPPKGPEVTDMTIQLIVKGETICDDVPNQKAWVDGAELHIGDTVLTVGVNLPTISGLSMPSSIMAGFPIFPKLHLEFADLNKSQFKWIRVRRVSRKWFTPRKSFDESHKKDAAASAGGDYDIDVVVSTDVVYTPTAKDVGHHLNLICVPKNADREGKEMSCLSKVEVDAGPGICPFDNRHLFTTSEAADCCFRVMTYNILADLYADSDFSRENLFSYCPAYALAIDYRKQLLLKEICGYQADIICLQEVDRKVFQGCLLPALDLLEYGGWLKLKGGEVAEGCAMFYRRSKFSLRDQKDTILSTFLKEDPVNKEMWDKICTKQELKEAMEQRTTALQVTVLESRQHPQHFLCVANTHLYFHPAAENIRIIQTALSLRFIHKICTEMTEMGKSPTVVFCGDFNANPCSGVVELITSGHIAADHPHWKSGGVKRYVRLDLSHDFDLVSSCGYPEYTNFTNGFCGTLDYIYIDSTKLNINRVIPMPDHEEVVFNIALPSVVFPSDHIALICDLKWNDV